MQICLHKFEAWKNEWHKKNGQGEHPEVEKSLAHLAVRVVLLILCTDLEQLGVSVEN